MESKSDNLRPTAHGFDFPKPVFGVYGRVRWGSPLRSAKGRMGQGGVGDNGARGRHRIPFRVCTLPYVLPRGMLWAVPFVY